MNTNPTDSKALPLWWPQFIRNICEITDRRSPEDEPDAIVATPDELAVCAINAIENEREYRGPWLNAQDMKALQRVDECFEDGEGYDVPAILMKRLAELGAVRHLARGAYEITAFGRYVLGSAHSRTPLETIDECNARLSREHRAELEAKGPAHG